jgi:hypothetical protein
VHQFEVLTKVCIALRDERQCEGLSAFEYCNPKECAPRNVCQGRGTTVAFVGVDGVRGLDLEGDHLASECLDEDLCALRIGTKGETEGGPLLPARI